VRDHPSSLAFLKFGTLENIHHALYVTRREQIGLLLMVVYIWP
jgi:hypothetical protein